jgi:hypothetical protein
MGRLGGMKLGERERWLAGPRRCFKRPRRRRRGHEADDRRREREREGAREKEKSEDAIIMGLAVAEAEAEAVSRVWEQPQLSADGQVLQPAGGSVGRVVGSVESMEAWKRGPKNSSGQPWGWGRMLLPLVTAVCSARP